MKIKTQPGGKMTETDRIQLASILVKAGYTVRIGHEKAAKGTVQVVEATGENEQPTKSD